MRIGLGTGGRTVDKAVAAVKRAADQGFTGAWFSNISGLDAITIAGIAGREVPGIDVGTSVVPTFTRHPYAMAQQAMTANDACAGRLVLGIGLSHQVVIESMLGLSFERPARHMKEYLQVLMPLLREGSVSHKGEVFRTRNSLELPRTDGPAVIVAALGPVMLRLAGELTDGTTTWMTGPRTIADHVAPTINHAAEAAGRPAPRVVVGLPVCVTDDVEGAKALAAKTFAIYGTLPSYRAMLDREGAEGPADVAIVGDEATVAARVRDVFDAGATEFMAAAFGDADGIARTTDLLATLL